MAGANPSQSSLYVSILETIEDLAKIPSLLDDKQIKKIWRKILQIFNHVDLDLSLLPPTLSCLCELTYVVKRNSMQYLEAVMTPIEIVTKRIQQGDADPSLIISTLDLHIAICQSLGKDTRNSQQKLHRYFQTVLDLLSVTVSSNYDDVIIQSLGLCADLAQCVRRQDYPSQLYNWIKHCTGSPHPKIRETALFTLEQL